MSDSSSLAPLRNRTFDELAVGDRARIERTLGLRDIQLFAAVSGDVNPQHLDPDYAAHTPFQGIIAHGMWGASLISAVLGTQLPGPGTLYLSQSLTFRAPVRVGDTVAVEVRITALEPQHRHVRLACACTLPDGTVAIEGEALVQAPLESIECARTTLPEIHIQDPAHGGLHTLLAHVRGLEPIRVAVVHSCDEISLRAALDARREGLIDPILVAPRARLERTAQALGATLDGLDIRDVPHSHAAAGQAVALARAGEVEALMKGSLHTDELMAAVVAGDGLRTKRRVSHCYLMQTPRYPRPFIITDAAINIAPTLDQKADIIRNAIDLAHAIGVAEPRVAILAAVETVSAAMPATLDAAALCKMADRGQITGGRLDGPLAFDNAVSLAAAHVKGIRSEVAGLADILVTPDLESGNMLAKQLMYLGDAASAGLVLGARVPIILTSRSDTYESRIASCALALLLARHYRSTPL
ncbi:MULTISPECIES: bifunctional enoyl-CoA hydratase/phosphate acetyltransferase [Castellaniella]|jgi:phosphate acetyltransferase/phosphate butyryltransferase|uniref:Phosphate acetyltransferase n=3 Tax=Castellaniella TaxID=359336 RepID=W8WZI3_CASD6|nr:bifunctional enoyl-CoA hydratase/phosphate acetyltransferase [Castellaniella defragrans]KAB0610614.1 bifunctional enoyl-CoA hydratase/phosphate acetyltransferase [Castellaniella defragrans]MBB6083145.1 phosphate acetyltransferase/phosphate butyryltransferase [Castellaniella defragrans]CDM25024.1 Phosphate acetyltransferase [Castellaniella defragrans 65Phen]